MQVPDLPRETFHGLPGLLADSLPDDFGTALINVWLANQGRTPETFNPVERLCYTGIRGMGALEYLPEQRRLLPGIRKPMRCTLARSRQGKVSLTGC